jgi:hypothetical protein
MSSSTGYHTADGFHVWWRPNQPDEIHVVSSDPQFNSADGEHPGLWITFSCNPKSANYHPQNFNRTARSLKANGCEHPAEVEEHDRRLNMRSKFIAAWKQAHGQS